VYMASGGRWWVLRRPAFGLGLRAGQVADDTTSQPQKGACEQNSTAPVGPSWRRLAVGPIPPAGWGTRSIRSHLGKRPEHEVPDFCPRRGGPGGALRSGPGLAEKGWGPRELGFESVPGGAPIGRYRRGAGAPEGARSAARGGQKYASKGWHGSSVETARGLHIM
jgi:hypothetical protein